MKEPRRRKIERTIEKQLTKGRDAQIFPAHNFRDVHGGIINDDRKLIGRHIIASPDDEIAKVLPGDCHLNPETLICE